MTYAHLSNVFANYATEVKAGQVVAVSADMLHIEVKYNGEELLTLIQISEPTRLGMNSSAVFCLKKKKKQT